MVIGMSLLKYNKNPEYLMLSPVFSANIMNKKICKNILF